MSQPPVPPAGPPQPPVGSPLPPAPVAVTAPGVRRTWDLVLTIVLLVLLIVPALIASYMAVFLVFAFDACSSDTCNDGLGTAGFFVAMIAPWAVLVVAAVVAIVLLVRRRPAFWVPLVALVLMALAWCGGAAIVFGSANLR